MRDFLFVCLITVFSTSINAKGISVISFKLIETDLTANTHGTMRKDQNGETAALIKIVTSERGFSFDGGSLGIVGTENKNGEIWLYVPRSSQKLTISHQLLGVLRNYYYPIPIQGGRTYEMVLSTGEVQTIVKEARTTQFVVFQLSPQNAVVEIDGELLNTVDGIATKMLKMGTHDYRVRAADYLQEVGKVTINDPNNKQIVTVQLKPNYTQVTLNVENNAEIWINGEKKGSGSWTGNLGAGTYEFETKKDNHRSNRAIRDIIVSEGPQIINLQSPTPIYGEAEINSTPAMADILIDGNKVGQTPQIISKLLIGNHNVTISKPGYDSYQGRLYIKEDEPSSLSVQLQAAQNSLISVGDVKFQMILVKGGSFDMGIGDDKHKVTVSDYYIGETEVTQKLWKTVMCSNPSDYLGKDRPVENVSWEDCKAFIFKLNQLTGLEFCLPTEAEWEFAARGGLFSNGYDFSGSNVLGDIAVSINDRLYKEVDEYNGHEYTYLDIEAGTSKIKTKKSNELGLYDMSGNVYEWCEDWYGKYPKQDNNSMWTFGTVDTQGPSYGLSKVTRGGSWRTDGDACLVSSRQYFDKSYRYFDIGLRLAIHSMSSGLGSNALLTSEYNQYLNNYNNYINSKRNENNIYSYSNNAENTIVLGGIIAQNELTVYMEDEVESARYNLQDDLYIQSSDNGQKYKIKNNGITIDPNDINKTEGKIHFSVSFVGIPKNIKKIDIINPDDKGWKLYGIELSTSNGFCNDKLINDL